ncbi:MAG: hypothetical protein WAU88_03735 [Candidatus Zixiibacteriota bacterium]
MSKRSRFLTCVISLLIICVASTNAALIYKPTDAALVPSPSFIDFPTFTHPSVAKNVPVILHNTGNTDLTFTSISKIEDSCKGPGCGPTLWLDYLGAPANILAGDSAATTLVLNHWGVITSGPTRLWGRIVFNYDSPSQSVTLPIVLTVADTIQGFIYDSVATNCSIKLAVGNNGNMGHNSIGNLNMNFRTNECDTGEVAPYISRGDASIYLGDGSPVIVRKVGSNPARLSYSMYNTSYDSPNGFKPLAVPYAVKKDTSIYQRYFSGEFLTVDSLVKVRRTWYAPKTSVDTCNIIIMKTQFTPNPPNTAVTNLLIGDAFDFDVPSDSGINSSLGGVSDASGYDLARRLVWARGYNSSDTVTDCWNNSYRYAGAALLTMAMRSNNNCTSSMDTLLYSGYSAPNDSFVYPTMGFVPEQMWTNMKAPGYVVEPRITDVHVVLTYKGGATAYTLPANDTLTVYTALAVTRSAANAAAGLDSLKRYVDKARKWCDSYVRFCGWGCAGDPYMTSEVTSPNCCVGTTGDVNMAGGVDLADLSALVSYITGGGYILSNPAEANINHNGGIDLADVSCLVSYLTGGGYVLPSC